MPDIKQARKALVKRILEGDGKASTSERRAAFNNGSLSEPLRRLIDKVAMHADRVTDEDISVAHLVSEGLGIAFVSMTGAQRIAERGAVVRPIADKELQTQVCLASRADNGSKLVSEFARAFMRRVSQVRKPPQSVVLPDSAQPVRPAVG